MRELETIYRQMCGSFAEKAGFSPGEGCDAAVRLYALAVQVQALEAETEWAVRQSFPDTAEGTYLDLHAGARGLARTQAVCAQGTLRFYADGAAETALTVPVGTVCLTEEGARFVTTEEAVIAAGEKSADAAAEAAQPGAAGNVPAGTVTLFSARPVGVVRCGNEKPFTGGADEEDDASLRERVLASYRRLPNGGNAAFYEEEAMRIAGVKEALAVGRARGTGTVDVYIAAEGGTPSAALVTQVAQTLRKKREIAVDVKVIGAAAKTVDVTASLAVEDGYAFEEVKQRAEAAVRAVFAGRRMGQSVAAAKLTAALCGTEGVANVHLSAPAADVTTAATELAVCGAVTLTEEA